jgi:hypothetical protein
MRRWYISTPDRDIAIAFLGAGCIAVLVSGVLWYVLR